MADTIFGEENSLQCGDCGEYGIAWHHWGSLVPPDASGVFCRKCWKDRVDRGEKGLPPLALGCAKTPGSSKEE